MLDESLQSSAVSPILLWTITVAAMVVAISLLAIILAKHLKKTLYSFFNIGCIAMLIFLSLFLVTIIIEMIYSLIENQPPDLAGVVLSLVAFPRAFALLSIPILVVMFVALLVSNIALMKHEGVKITNMVAAGTMAIYLLALILTLVLQSITRLPVVERAIESLGSTGTWAVTIVLMICYDMICYFECVYAAIIIMGFAAARQKPKYDKDYIIILGCAIRKNGKLMPLIKGRTERAIRYAWEQEIATGKPVHYVPSGGKGTDEIMSEGSAMELYLLSHSAEPDEILAEKKSSNTYENFLFSKRLIDEEKPDARVAFATTKYHMLRSGMLARKAGFEDIEAIGSDTKWYFWPNGFAREVVGILSYNKVYHLFMLWFFTTVTLFYCAIVMGGM